MKTMDAAHKILDTLYTDSRSVAGFAGVRKLYEEGKKIFPKLKVSDVQTYLTSQATHTEYGRQRFRFLKRPVFTSKPELCMTADLADFQNLSEFNEGFKYVLFVLDYFSRKLTIYTVKDKKSSTIGSCFNKYLKKYPKYKFLHTDEGSEFYGRGNTSIF